MTTYVDPAVLPPNEAARMDAVRRYDVLDTPPDGAFDRVTRIASTLLEMPIAIVTIVDNDRIWFKSAHGLDVEQIDRDPGLCASAILHEEAWVIGNAETDPRTLANPLVAGEFGLRFHAGVPPTTSDGYTLGPLCVIDRPPREPPPFGEELLRDLAAIVVDELELRLSALRAAAAVEQRARQATDLNDDVVQSLAVAKLQLEVGDAAAGLESVGGALEASKRILTELVSGAPTLRRGSRASD
jgi:GAF domain-containing protein